ncbi:hypothetical protein P8625_14065 [Tenacibaculum tangerinum]|uniref:DUF3240 domain-containing protein n=1 Tax=Tenacibaculum tangerinum TaxID=3038772 RepID=A0ABY8L3H7_9FLAO|nr:hypothetical protein [Tenacibaculum tangerinum]WGH75182.1 hypothetical protein P8625_14065 [Tenacibaculum tangerinum]
MKLLIITVVEGLQNEVIQLLKEAGINNFSASDIEGFRNSFPVVSVNDWFSGNERATSSYMYFSFTEPEKIEVFFKLVTKFNTNLETNNPIRAIVVPVEKHI